MRILVTGGGGQLASEWARLLKLKKDIEYIILNRQKLDITDSEMTKNVIRGFAPDVIINTAAYTSVDLAEDHPDEAFAVNRDGVGNLASVCREQGIKLVHYSTDYVFSGKSADAGIYPGGYAEDHERIPNNVYGQSKKEGEDVLRNSGCEYLLIRVAWLCGAAGNNFVKTMLRLANEKDRLQVVNDQTGAPSFCWNVAENTLCLLRNQISGIYHLASTEKVTWYDFANEIFRLSGKEVEVEAIDSKQFSQKAERPAFSLLNTEKISTIEGIKLTGLTEALKQLLEELNEFNED